MTFARHPGIPWTGRRGPLVAEAVVLGVLVVLDMVLAARAMPGQGQLVTIAAQFAPGVGPVVALLAVLRRRFPDHIAGLATAVSGLSLLGSAIATLIAVAGTRLPPQPGASETFAIALVVGACCHRLSPRAATVQAVLGGAAATLAPLLRYGTGSPAALYAAAAAVVWGGALAGGLVLRDAEVRHRVDVLELRSAERLRLARELHDLVAHQITGIVVRVQAAHRVAERTGGDTATFAELETAGATALSAMRRLVGALRTGDEDLFVPPADLATAVDRAVPDDDRIHLDVSPDLATLAVAPEVVTTAHRLLTESLTNVRRHAPDAAEVRVLVHHEPRGELRVEVVNDGAARPARRGGYGLLGMAERVAAVGGTVQAGPAEGRRWRVLARLPLEPG
ncbi:two-component sensor histidine kinase [Amycolatopsis sp. NBRC 101858]|uniref:sensor histidine kinase n=1 Tax=Amycolatopsis sp. NBRC 101858 TaxID=3032200 RepID=UPI0024A09080|nr:histidine kinase [Amycolatopsis sp. NBRC 101858]GLY40150.1 two-component sensor histidine kinase [Amycolatopsis sp. NBRC 101858]